MNSRWFRVGRIPAATAAAASAVFVVAWLRFPFPADKLERYPAGVTVSDRHGTLLRVTLGVGDSACQPVQLSATGPWLARAVVAAEDQRFWKHPGVDGRALVRAIHQNISAGRVVSGASTITTQLMRLLEPRPRRLSTKLIEAFRALQVEQRLSKAEILEQYLNRAPFGSNLVGVEAASRRYFGKAAADLSLSEAALIAGLLQSPSRLRPDRHPDRARQRRDYVLERMLACGYITPEQQTTAAAVPVQCARRVNPFAAPHFCDWILARYPGLTQLRTTLDGRIQEIAEEVLHQHAPALAAQDIHGGAIVVLDVQASAVRALVGSPDYWDTRHAGQVNVALARRSPGSALKPFLFALAMDQGLCTPATMIEDTPLILPAFAPQNFDRTFSGPVSVREALVRSLNLPALRMAQEFGVDNLVAELRQAGLTSIDRRPQHYGLGVALGNAEVPLLELANAYAVLAREGSHQPLRFLETELPAKPVRFISAETSYLVADILGGDERAREFSGHAADVRFPRVAWKTGTSAGFRDAWMIGYNPDYVVGVWLGNPNGRGSPSLVGATVAAPLVNEIFRRLYPTGEAPWFSRPAGLVERALCAASGGVPTAGCRTRIADLVIPGISRLTPCRVHRPDRDQQPAKILRIRTPATGEEYWLQDNSVGQRQQIALVAEGGGTDANLYWFADNQLLGTAPAGEPLYWVLQRGVHTIACADENGRTASTRIRVR